MCLDPRKAAQSEGVSIDEYKKHIRGKQRASLMEISVVADCIDLSVKFVVDGETYVTGEENMAKGIIMLRNKHWVVVKKHAPKTKGVKPTMKRGGMMD